MPITPARPSLSTLVTTLRSAGCVFAEDEARLLLAAAQTPEELATMVRRRVDGVPLEYVLGWAEFHGLRIAVTPGVFVPRRRTEFLAHQAAALTRPGAVVVDLCCGAGAISAVLKAEWDPVELHAVDIDPAAVACARRNVAGAQFYVGDLYEPLPATLRGGVDILVANAPYVPTEAVGLMPPEARLHESLTALDGGSDGLDILRRVLAGAPQWLAPGGFLLVETSEQQAPQLIDAAIHSGLTARVAEFGDLNATIVIATKPTG